MFFVKNMRFEKCHKGENEKNFASSLRLLI
jgi:hypothetical protein